VTTRRGSRGPFARSTATKPRLTWVTYRSGELTLVSLGRQVLNLGDMGTSPSLSDSGVQGDFTIRRIRGNIYSKSTRATESGDTDTFLWGVLIVSVQAFNTGAASVPSPENDNADWMVWGSLQVEKSSTGAANFHPIVQVPLETKAMRKVNENNQIVCLSVKNAGGDSMVFGATGRMLVSHGRG